MNLNKAFYPFIFSLILASGIYLGYKIQERNASKNSFFNRAQTGSKLDYILGLIEAKYVDTVNTNKLYDDAIAKMLEDLDPHSVYLPPMEMEHETEIMSGNFEGIGIEFSIQNDTIQVVTPISGGPSESVGINAGDKIIKINDTLVAGNGITNEMVMKKLKGAKGTKVNVTMLKSGSRKLITYTIKRDKIPIYSVDAGFMIDNKTGYIKINRFSQTTYQEFYEKLELLKKAGIQNLILDLRQNPGGFMDQATAIADEFLDGNKTIVYTEGRSMPRTYDKARTAGLFEQGKLAILIDEGSASASEIVSGAIQDWDTGILIGRRTFGKGLVQQEFGLGDGSSLRLTIAKYYTPSGRSIQRPYDEGTEDYYNNILMRYKDGEVFNKDSIKQEKKTLYKTLVKGRTVYGGGGITPDIYIPIDTSMLNPFVNDVLSKGILQEFAYNFFAGNKNLFTKYNSIAAFNSQYVVNDQLYTQFVDYCKAHDVELKTIQTYAEKSKSFLAFRLKALFAKQGWKTEGYYQIAIKDDHAVQRALQEFSK